MRTRFASASRDTFRSLHVANFRKFFFGQLVSQIGNWLTLIAQTLLVLHLTNKSGVAVGVLAACQFAPVLVLGAWAGLIADRSDKRKLLVIVQVIAMAQSFVLAALAFSGHPPVWSIDLVAVIGGCTVAFDNPARRAFVVEMVDGEDVSNAVSLNSALMTSARIIGPAFAGLLVIIAGYGWCFTLDALSYIAVIIAFLKMNPAELRLPPVTERARKQIRAGLSYVRTVPDLWIPLLMMAVVGTLSFNFQVVLSLFVEKTFHGGTGMFTLLFSTTAVGSLMGALSTARRKTIETRDVIVASLAFGIAMFVLAASPDLALAFPLGIALGWTSISFMTASTAIVNLRSAPEMRGRVLALQAIVFLGSTPIGGPLLGVICDVYGARAGLIVGGVAALGAALFGMLVVRRHARRVASVTPELNRVDAAQASYAR
jgi:MFS family permease